MNRSANILHLESDYYRITGNGRFLAFGLVINFKNCYLCKKVFENYESSNI